MSVLKKGGGIKRGADLSSSLENVNSGIGGLIFSRDRAMQLQATIESFFLHCRDSRQIKLSVLYKATNRLNQCQYNRLEEKFGNISFIREVSFKEQLIRITEKFEYVLFLVDDNLFVRDFHLADVTGTLQHTADAIGFSLRLGKNTNYCYSRDVKQSLPVFRQADTGVLKYNWTQAECDFGYPLELSSSVYRVSDILRLLAQLEFANPNVLEDMMAVNAAAYAAARAALLCYENSVAFCNPVNKVQSVFNNRTCGDHRYSADRLAEMFEDGLRIDVEKYSNFLPNSCHQEVPLYFREVGLAYQKPKFSVVMANYNNAEYIAEAVESVLNQTFSNWELIIVEDCSTDNSPEIIKNYLGDGRIRLIQHQRNSGYTASLKTGISNVRAEFFGILDGDDCLLPDAVKTMYEQHIEFPEFGLIYSQFAYCHRDLTRRCIGFCDKIPPGKTSLDANVVSHFKSFKLCDYMKTSGYDENILYAEDVDIAYKMEEVTGLKFVDKCLYLYRELPDSICHSKNKINVAIMSRAKARINALKRRSAALAQSTNQSFERLFCRSVKKARAEHKDVEQYFEIVTKLYEKGLLAEPDLPSEMQAGDSEYRLLRLAADVTIKFDRLFELLANQKKQARQPLVSVYMVAYNAEKFIAQAIDSVLAQSYKNFELLVVDDGSTDRTKKLITSYSDERVRYIYQEHKNFASGMNRAITESRGQYLIGVDADDFIAPDYIEKMVAFAEEYPQVDYFYPAKLTLVDEFGDLTAVEWEYQDFSDNSVLPAFIFANGYGPIPNPGSLKRKSVFDKTGLYDELDTVEDFAFLCKNALKINFKRLQQHSAYFYRRLSTGNSLKFRARNQIMADVLNEMVSIYPAEMLYPQIAAISDAALKQHRYYEYLANTFDKHANGPMVRFSRYFQQYADHYRTKLLAFTEQRQRLIPG